MNTEIKVEVWITKYALTSGILHKHGIICNDTGGKMIRIPDRFDAYYHKPDWHLTLADAISKAEEMRTSAIKKAKIKIDKLEKMKFGETSEL